MATKTDSSTNIAGAAAGKTSVATPNPLTSLGGQEGNGSPNSSKPLRKFFMDALKDIYWAEKALTEALPKMQKAATTEELREAFEDHTLITQKHVARLEKVFRQLGKPAEARKCEAMQGLIKEGEAIIEQTPEGTMTRDAALIIAAQKVEHYEIASYGGLVQLALTLGEENVANILDQTLQEEEETDAELTDIAEEFVNFDAEEETAEDAEA